MKLWTSIFVLFFVCSAQTLHAEPMLIEFTEMMQQAKTIVVADYLGFVNPNAEIHNNYRLLVHRVLKGKAKLDTIVVGRAHGGVEHELKPNTPCVAFLNYNNEFEWVATTKGSSLEKDLLFLRGFYDYNAYIVAPSGQTIQQLETFITKGFYSVEAAGKLHFYNSKTQDWQPSDAGFVVKGQYPNGPKEVQVEGLNLGDFAKAEPNFNMPGGSGIFSLVYEPNMVRPLKFKGQLQEFDPKTQRYNAMFWVTNPEEMTKDLFEDYLNNPQHGHPFYEIEIKTSKGNTYLFTYGKERGRIGSLSDFEENNWSCSSLGDPSDQKTSDITFGHFKGERVIIRMDKLDKLVNYYEHPYRQNRLIRILRVHPLTGSIIIKNKNDIEKVLDRCSISIIATKWARNPNFRD